MSSRKSKTIIHLLENRRNIEGQIRELEAKLQTPIDPDLDEADPQLSEYDVTMALLDNARRKIEDIDRALDQNQAGRYGICEDCQDPIDPERLEIFPQTTLCVKCKAQRETGTLWQAA